MPSLRRRGARLTVAPLAASSFAIVFALTGCGGSSGVPVASTQTPASPAMTSTPPAPVADPAAAAAVAAAERAMGHVLSYRFVADEQLQATTLLTTQLSGSVVRGQGLTYRLAVGHKTTEVVRLPAATYVRIVPHGWSRLRRPRQLLNPTATLLQILHSLRPTRLASVHGVKAVNGVLDPAAAHSAGLPATKPADVTVTMDRQNRVIALEVQTAAAVGGREVIVRLRTAYSGFDAVGRIRKPV